MGHSGAVSLTKNALQRAKTLREGDEGGSGVADQEFTEMGGICSLETIDGLLLVPHHKEIRVLIKGEAIEKCMLVRISVLMLVCKEVLELFLESGA